jgi:integrator complex subunit 3
MGSQKRYQQWFSAKWLSTPEAETVICDIMRFICCCYHPSNAVLSSDVIPRWAVIGWLLQSIRVELPVIIVTYIV